MARHFNIIYYLFMLLHICYGFNYDFSIPADKFLDEGLPTSFNDNLKKLSEANFFDQTSVGTFNLEQLVLKLAGIEWFPKIDSYFEKAGLTRSDITLIRTTRLTELMKYMPRYNLTDFWELPFKVLVNGVKFYSTSDGINDVLNLLKDVYKRQNDSLAIIKEFSIPNSASYMNVDRDKVLQLVEKIHVTKTTSLMKMFGLNEKTLTFVAHDSFETVNKKYAQLLFTNLHQDYNEMKTAQETFHNLLSRLQLYRESVYTWSHTCPEQDGTLSTKEYGLQTLNEITKRCFAQPFDNVVKNLFNIEVGSGVIEKLPISDVSQLVNDDTLRNTVVDAYSFINASVLRIDAFEKEKQKPFLVIAQEKTKYPIEQIQKSTLDNLLQLIHKLKLDLILKLYGVSMNQETRIDINHIPFDGLIVKLNNRVGNATYSLQQWQIVSLSTIISGLNNNLTGPELQKAILNAFVEFGLYKIDDLQTLSVEKPTNSSTLYSLAQMYFGLTMVEFFKLYEIPASQYDFFKVATLADIASLSAPQANINLYSIKDLINIVQPDFAFNMIMLTTIRKLQGNHTLAFFKDLSVLQIAEDYAKRKEITISTFGAFIKRWSNSDELLALLDYQKFSELMRIIQVTDSGMLDLRLLDILNAILVTFGDPCNLIESNFCRAQQFCQSIEAGSTIGRCKCRKGYRFTAKNQCSDIDECQFANVTCPEQALCINTEGSYTCKCRQGYESSGKECLDINECQRGTHNCDINANCYNTEGGFFCSCRGGFRAKGIQCENINECHEGSSNCHEQATCFDVPGTFICRCNLGFLGDGRTCQDINECKVNEKICPEFSTCENTVGSYKCHCNDKYIQDGQRCLKCLPNQLQYCHEDAECLNLRCICKKGFQPYEYDSSICVDKDECNTNLDLCGYGYCENLKGSYKCVCNEGFQHETIGKATSKCVDINECDVASSYGKTLCPNKYQYCKNEFGTYSCITERPNTEMRVALGVTIPLVLVLTALMFGMYFLHRRMKASKELRSFDDRLKAMYVNRAYEFDSKSDVISIVGKEEDTSSTTSIIPKNNSMASSATATQGKDSSLKRTGSLNNLFKKNNILKVFSKDSQ